MTTIATLTEKTDGALEGTLATLNVTAPIAVVPNTRKAKENAPDYRIISRKNGFELGAGWNRISRNTGEEYVSVSLSAPEFGGVIYGTSRLRPAMTRRRRSSSGTRRPDHPAPASLAGAGARPRSHMRPR